MTYENPKNPLHCFIILDNLELIFPMYKNLKEFLIFQKPKESQTTKVSCVPKNISLAFFKNFLSAQDKSEEESLKVLKFPKNYEKSNEIAEKFKIMITWSSKYIRVARNLKQLERRMIFKDPTES